MKFPEIYTARKNVNIIIEAPYKSRNKFIYDEATDMFKLKKVLPLGFSFPCNMGFIPHTKAEDGDPLDALVFMDELTYPGCVIESRVVGIIKATQQEKNKAPFRNDRVIAFPAAMKDYDDILDITDMNKNKLKELVYFFECYNTINNKVFKLLELGGAEDAHTAIKEARLKIE